MEATYFLGTVEAFFRGIHDGYDVGVSVRRGESRFAMIICVMSTLG